MSIESPVTSRLPVERDLPDAPPVAPYVVAGLLVVGVLVGGAGYWSATAPLTSSAMAPGIVRADSHRKTIQHLEGGVIAEILVHDGDRVRAGQVLVTLTDTDARADRNALAAQIDELGAQRARLVAERYGANAIVFPAELTARSSDPEVAKITAEQQTLFEGERAALEAQIAVWAQRKAQYGMQLPLAETGIVASNRKTELLNRQLADTRKLLDKQLALKSLAYELERQVAIAQGELASEQSALAALRSQLSEADLQVVALRHKAAEDAAQKLDDAGTRLSDLRQQLDKASARYARHDIIAPQNGIVMNSRYFAAAAVVPPGGAVLDLVPQGDQLTIEAQIQPLDMDVVRRGLAASVRLIAYKQRTTPVIDGTVLRVSPDAVTDEKSGRSYFKAEITVDGEELARLYGVGLYPGMPVDVSIVTGKRTLFDYLVQPVGDSFAHAFQEQ